MDSAKYLNPYSGKSFFGFFLEFFSRLYQFLTGNISVTDIASDEIQIIVLGGVAISAALVGCFLILRKMTMLANSLSHTILLGIVLAYYFSSASLSGGNHDGTLISKPCSLRH